MNGFRLAHWRFRSERRLPILFQLTLRLILGSCADADTNIGICSPPCYISTVTDHSCAKDRPSFERVTCHG